MIPGSGRFPGEGNGYPLQDSGLETEPYTCQVFKTRVKVTDVDGQPYTITDETELDEVKEAIKYDRRRLNKAWRIFKSDNPDWELEHDTEDED